MDDQSYKHCQLSHRRVIMAETLHGAEQAAYEAGRSRTLRRDWSAIWSAYGLCARKSPRRQQSNSACEYKRRNSTPVSSP